MQPIFENFPRNHKMHTHTHTHTKPIIIFLENIEIVKVEANCLPLPVLIR